MDQGVMRSDVLVALVLCACSSSAPPAKESTPQTSRAARQRDASKYRRMVDQSPGSRVSRVDDGQENAPPPVPPSTAVCTVKGEYAPFESCTPRQVPVAGGKLRGPTLATFEPEGVRMTWAVLKDESRGLWIDVRDDQFILTGYVDGSKEPFLARRDVEVLPARAWVLAGARLTLAGGTPSGVSVRVEDDLAEIQDVDLQMPCDAIAYEWSDVTVTPVPDTTVEPAMYAIPARDVLRLYSAPDGEVVATLRPRDKPWLLPIEVYEHATPWARVRIMTGSARFDAWVSQADLGSDPGGFGMSGIGSCGRSGSAHPLDARAAVASARVTVAVGPHEKGADGLVMLPGASVRVVASRDGFYKIEPVSSTIRPPKGASFWVLHEALDGP